MSSALVRELNDGTRIPARAALIPLSLVLLSGCGYRAPVYSKDISNYRGDGVASKIHSALDPGVRIEFERFPLSKPYQAIYQLKSLPLRPTAYRVELVVDSPGEALVPHRPRGAQYGLAGELHLRLIDRGEFASREGSLFDYTWSPEEDGWSTESGRSPEGSFVVHAVAGRLGTKIEHDAIMLAAEGHLVLEVSWNPSGDVSAKEAWVRMESGGTE